ncbi:glycosyltransferase [Bradyrhizobium sp. CCGB12]|uniref:nucleotide disphospho-sugar-binding domain-containing protein n=1 Tax=Bradyrhizobium sp. CCGB12 TaxID=2949632 RepID=UPI0020B4173C|nr:nucleotide disphospho-sugar-binding domain-containing protein [Bradyrhizobium sp. CCGB12]MCP3390607.1 glycosyltransferase [Bradyrhizobium sp. CCGB12]
MKLLFASTPATSQLNALLAVTRILLSEGHDIALLTGTAFRGCIKANGLTFFPLPPEADFNLRDILGVVPDLNGNPGGSEWFCVASGRLFVDAIAPQHLGLIEALRKFPADIIVGDDLFFGVLPMLLGPCAKRPPITLCGTSILHWQREDGAPNFLGLPPATTDAQLEQYEILAAERDLKVDQPILCSLNKVLKAYRVGPISMPLFHSVVELADAYMQLSVPGFEFPRELPPTVHFVGTPPIIPDQIPLPPWAHELDGSRKVVLVTQGTGANHSFELLVAPTLAGLANEPDVLVVATAGGRPTETIPGPIPSNARVASYLPFEWLLPRVDVFVTNGGYGSVNQALSFGIPLVTAGLTEGKADVNARVAWSGVGIDLATNAPSPDALRNAVRSVVDRPDYSKRASQMASEFASINTRSEILWIINQLVADRQVSRPVGASASRGRRVNR